MLKIIEKTKLWFSISLIVILIGMVSLGIKGLNLGIDFKGGTLVQINFGKSFDKVAVNQIVHKYDSGAVTNAYDNTGFQIKSNVLDESTVKKMFNEMKDKYKLKESSLQSVQKIGPAIGNELTKNAIIALVIANLAMLVYVGFRFEFKFASAAILALVHDILVTVGMYSLLGIVVNSPFIAALLTIVGYSINDTVVVFDRVRENTKLMKRASIDEVANASITQTMTRSIYTVVTVLIATASVHIFVPSVREFTIPILIGLFSGCYSSIFIATPLWVVFKKISVKNKKNRNKIAS